MRLLRCLVQGSDKRFALSPVGNRKLLKNSEQRRDIIGQRVTDPSPPQSLLPCKPSL